MTGLTVSTVGSAKTWVCVSAGTCVASFVFASIPYLQWTALVLTIAAAIRAWRKGK